MERVVEWNGHQTWCEIRGDIGPSGRPPVVLIHGGPGLPSDYLTPLMALADSGRGVVRYDQLGCGNSAFVSEDDSLWVMDTFVDELEQVTEKLGLERFYLLGHSWGGWLALEYAIRRRPKALAGLVLASTCSSLPRFAEVTRELKAQLPQATREVLDRHEEEGTTDSEEYFGAFMEYASRWLIRTDIPGHLMASVERKNDDIYRIMQGPEWNVNGNLRDWDVTDRLGEIEVPVLVTSGRHDEMTPELIAPMVQRIPHSEWVIFENSAHMAFIEETDRYLETVNGFLATVDQSAHRGVTA